MRKIRLGAAVQRKMLSRIISLCAGIAIVLVTVVAGCSQSPGGLDDSEGAAMDQVREIAAVAARLRKEIWKFSRTRLDGGGSGRRD